MLFHTMIGLTKQTEKDRSETFKKLLEGAAMSEDSLDGPFGSLLGETVNIQVSS
jgi:hypothetical protein